MLEGGAREISNLKIYRQEAKSVGSTLEKVRPSHLPQNASGSGSSGLSWGGEDLSLGEPKRPGPFPGSVS